MAKIAYGTVTDDPLLNLPIGTSISFPLISYSGSNGNKIPQSISNWEFFKGAVLNFGFKKESSTEIIGTAVIIAPGLALTATHNFINEVDQMKNGKIVPFCIGIRENSADFWKITNVSFKRDDDIALLAISAGSALPGDNKYYRFGITTRTPKNGEILHIIGFRNEAINEEENGFEAHASLYTSQGTVVAVYPYERDKLLIPYPVIELDCGSLGGMSGGAVLDKNGLLMGIISRGWQTLEGDGPTYASWLIKAFDTKVLAPWPSGIYDGPTSIMTAHKKEILYIERPDMIKIEDQKIATTIWFE